MPAASCQGGRRCRGLQALLLFFWTIKYTEIRAGAAGAGIGPIAAMISLTDLQLSARKTQQQVDWRLKRYVQLF